MASESMMDLGILVLARCFRVYIGAVAVAVSLAFLIQVLGRPADGRGVHVAIHRCGCRSAAACEYHNARRFL